jgi:hypothetical protein
MKKIVHLEVKSKHLTNIVCDKDKTKTFLGLSDPGKGKASVAEAFC